jgi:hypothetical protein
MIRMLEEAAYSFEKGLLRAIGKIDDMTDAWLLDEITKRADGIRQLKRPVCLPTSDTSSQITHTLEQWISIVTRGAWAEIPIFEPPHERNRRSWQAALLAVIRHLLISFLPLAILSIARVTGTELDPTISTYLWTSAIGWAILGVVLTFDPLLRDKLGIIKDAAGTWRTIHGGGK